MNLLLKIAAAILVSLSTVAGHAQEQPGAPSTIDSVQLKNLRGKPVSYSSLVQKNSVVLICFWSVNSDASISEINAINAHYEKWNQLASFRLLAICVDEGNNSNRMRTTANMNAWTFEVYEDVNGDLRRILHSVSLPQSMILVNGKTVYQQSGYETGSEEYLFNKVLSLSPAKK